MGRKRVLALGPALSRMRSGDRRFPYEKINNGAVQVESHELLTTTTKAASSAYSRFWAWRRKPKKLKLGGNKSKQGRGRWGFKVSRLRIRLVSPLLLLKKLRDSYIRMMLALERNCGEYGGALAMTSYPMYPMYPFPISNVRISQQRPYV